MTKIRQEGLALHSHWIKKRDEGMSGTTENIPFQDMSEEGCIRRDRENGRSEET
jgi:hypothetical protein